MSQSSERVFLKAAKVNLPDPYLIAIGHVCVQWSLLESIVDLMIGKFLGFDHLDPRTTMLTAHMTWPLKMDVLGSFAEGYRAEYPHLECFPEVSRMLRKAQEGRNKIVHARWSVYNEKVQILRATARGRLKTSMDPVEVSDIMAIAEDIGTATVKLYRVIINV